MINYNLQQIEGKLSFQPNRRYKRKIIFCLLIAVIAFTLPWFLSISYDITCTIQIIGVICAAYALYDFLFKMNLTYIFDQTNRQVYRKAPGIYTRKLMSLEEVYILLETENCELHYVLSNKKDRYGKGYNISDYFLSTKRGKEEQERYEIEVLGAIQKMIVHK